MPRIKQYDYLIVGSGLSGATFAREAMDHGKSCLVLDKRPHIGGNIYNERVADIDIHRYGAHIFHTHSKRVWQYVNRFVTFNHFINSPVANYKGETYNLPFNMNTFSKMWNLSTPAEAEERIAQQRGEISGEPRNLEQQAIKLVGRDIYSKLIQGYTEKQWGRSCRDLPPDIIKRLPVRFVYDNNYFDDPYQGVPCEGYNLFAEKLLSGADIKLNSDYLADRKYWSGMAEKVVYSGMIDAYYDYLFGPLAYRSLLFEDEVLDISNYQGVAVMNFTDAETPYTRVVEHKHFTFGQQKQTVITREYPREWSLENEPYYPVRDRYNLDLYQKYATLALNERNVLFIGRLAQYAYYDMDMAIAAALEAADIEFGFSRP